MLARRAATWFGRVRRMTRLGSSDLDVFPLCLGGNVFGWTADEADSFAVLDAYAAAGGNFIDTADVLLGVGSRPLGRRVGDDHRQVAEPRAATATR